MYFSFLPDPFNFFKSFSVISFSPLSRKTTIPMCLSAGISKRSSEATKASNCFAKWTPLNHIKIGFESLLLTIVEINILFVVIILYISYLTNVCLQSFNTIITDDEPQLQSSKPFAKRNLPVLVKYIKINGGIFRFRSDFYLKCCALRYVYLNYYLPCNRLQDLT